MEHVVLKNMESHGHGVATRESWRNHGCHFMSGQPGKNWYLFKITLLLKAVTQSKNVTESHWEYFELFFEYYTVTTAPSKYAKRKEAQVLPPSQVECTMCKFRKRFFFNTAQYFNVIKILSDSIRTS